MAFLLSIAFLAISLVFFLFKLNGERGRTTNLPYSPPKLPIIGNLHQIASQPQSSVRSFAEKYGPIFLIHLGQRKAVVVSTAELAKEVLKTHDITFAGRPSLTAPREVVYGGSADILFSPYGDYWREVRKISVLELLSPKKINYFRPVMEDEVGLMLESISQSSSKGSTLDLSKLLLSLTNNIITMVALGKKYEGEFRELGNKLFENLGEILVGDFVPSLAWIDVLKGTSGKLKRYSRKLDAFLEEVIEDHLVSAKVKEGGRKDLVDVMLELQRDSMLDFQLTRDNLKAIILDMFVGGGDTTASALEFAMAELLKNPNIMEKVQAEIRSVVGKDAEVKEEHIHQMHYLKLVIKESLRLHPVAPALVPRESTKDVMVKGYHIPAKTIVVVNAWAIGRDPKSWEKPEEFLPERFINSPIDFKGQDFQYLPFGSGRRGCPGLSFGINLVELGLANLLYWFNWELPPGTSPEDIDLTETLGFVVHLKTPLYLMPKQYNSKDEY